MRLESSRSLESEEEKSALETTQEKRHVVEIKREKKNVLHSD